MEKRIFLLLEIKRGHLIEIERRACWNYLIQKIKNKFLSHRMKMYQTESVCIWNDRNGLVGLEVFSCLTLLVLLHLIIQSQIKSSFLRFNQKIYLFMKKHSFCNLPALWAKLNNWNFSQERWCEMAKMARQWTDQE